ncbi:hypothetical protein [Rurimicrobium arvi]|uniref:YhhN-like protein n=1 Tax=Rurimicrobium arvi TaxID=2049916 RepID=A0ABP8MWN2_9BACT
MFTKILTTLGVDAVGLFIALFLFPKLSKQYRLLAVYAIITGVAEISGSVMNEFHILNTFLFSVYGICAYIVLSFFCFTYDQNKKAYLAGIPIAIAAWVFNLYQVGPDKFLSLFFGVHALLLVMQFFVILYRTAISTDGNFLKQPVLYVSLGIIFFYGCSAHYWSVLHYFVKESRPADERLADILVLGFSNLKGIFMIICLLLAKKESQRAVCTRR